MIIQRGNDPGPFSQHRQYVTHLRELFRRRCAYCLTPDDRLGGEEAMKVDHFQPESRYQHLRLVWTNLYYCCDVCNNRKSNFPTPQEEAAGERFVDPCLEDPDHHFQLVRESAMGDFCRVISLTRPAEYEVKRLQFNRRPFLRDFWRELHARERTLQSRRGHILELRSFLSENDADSTPLLSDFQQELARIDALWPFPRIEVNE